MLNRLILATLLAMMLVPILAQAQDTCTFTSSGNMDEFSTPNCTAGMDALVSCGASCTDDDDFVIPTGITVTVNNDLTCDTTAGCSITIQSGGTLTSILAADATTPRVLAIGKLTLDSGGTLTLTGAFLENNVASPGSTVLPTFPDNAFFVPNPSNEAPGTGLEQCVDLDCSTESNTMRFSWTENASAAIGDQNLGDALANLAVGQVVWFWDNSPTGYVGSDASAPYLITVEEALALEFDVRQGAFGTHIAFDERDLISGTIAAAHGQGARDIDVCVLFGATFTVESDRNDNSGIVSRWIRFEDGAGFPRPRAYKIMQTDNDGSNDIIRLGDPRGIANDITAGDDYWIDNGWTPGDPFLIVVPIHVQAAVAGQDTFAWEIDGAYTLRGVIVDRFHLLRFNDNATGIADYVWDLDAGMDGSAGGAVQIDNDNQVFNWFALTGGNGDECDVAEVECTGVNVPCQCCSGAGAGDCDALRSHAITWGLTSEGAIFNDTLVRHSGDDFVSRNSLGGSNDLLTLNRVVFQHMPEEASSANCYTTNDGAGRIAANDLICDATAYHAGGGAVGDCYRAIADVAADVKWPAQRGVMLWGGGVCTPTSQDIDFINFAWIGTRSQAANNDNIAKADYRNFIFRDIESLEAGIRLFGVDNAAGRSTLHNGIIVNMTMNSEILGSPIIQRNVAWINLLSSDPNCDGGSNRCRIHHYTGTELPGTEIWDWQNVTYAWSQNVAAQITRIFSWSSGASKCDASTSVCRMENILYSGLPEEADATNQSPFVVTSGAGGSHEWSGNICFYDNHFKGTGVAVDPDLLTAIDNDGGAVIRDVAPGFVDIEHADVEIPPHSPLFGKCGAKVGAGIVTPTWAMIRSKLGPECVGCSQRGSARGRSRVNPLAY